MPHTKPFAEIIESSLHGWIAQSWQWDHFPPFGSLVSVTQRKKTFIGLVHQVKTGSIDPTRSPFAYQKTEEELLKEQPQIFAFLKTTFSSILLGYQEEEKITYALASEPAKIHSFVQLASPEISKQFFNNPDYLHLLFGFAHHVDNLDELLLALLNSMAKLSILTYPKLEHFMNTYSLLTGNDYRRIKLFLHRAQQIPLAR